MQEKYILCLTTYSITKAGFTKYHKDMHINTQLTQSFYLPIFLRLITEFSWKSDKKL